MPPITQSKIPGCCSKRSAPQRTILSKLNAFAIAALFILLPFATSQRATASEKDGSKSTPTASKTKAGIPELSRIYNAVPFSDVHFTDSFWAPRIKTNRLVSVPHNIDWCEKQTGRIDNFKKASGQMKGEFRGIYFDDSDVYKILEGFAYTLAAHPDPKLKKVVENWVKHIAAVQEPDGYLMCYFKLVKPKEKWTNLGGMHELYCAGHMAEAAVALARATGDESLLNVSKKQMDLICKRFGSAPGQIKNVAGHEEIELALVKLYQLTGEKKYLEEAKFFIDTRGVAEGREKGLFGEYCQDHMPVRKQSEIVGHAVRAMYLYAGATDIAGYYNDAELMAAMKRLWNNVTREKMYITGGIGSHAKNEGFGAPYFLPNASAYCETCAAIGLVLWAHRMNLATGSVEYAEVMKQAMYNGMLSGYGLNGDSYFYVNPLESAGNHHRQPFFNCACCPSNVIRVLASLPGYAYATTRSTERQKSGLPGDDTIVVNMFVDSKASIKLADGTVELTQKTNYPYDGKIRLTVRRAPKDTEPSVLPVSIVLNYTKDGKPAVYKSTHSLGKEAVDLSIDIPLSIERMTANPNVKDDLGRVALKRGPLVYCFEQCDNDVPINQIILAKDPQFQTEPRVNFISSDKDNSATKNSPMRTTTVITCKDINGKTLTAIPYSLWDNRKPGKMSVWVLQAGFDPSKDTNWTGSDGRTLLYKPLDSSKLSSETICVDLPPRFSASFDRDTQSKFDGSDPTVKPNGSGDQRSPRATFWDHRGTAEWFQYDFLRPKQCSSMSVYWFDDSGVGQCRVPQSWKLQYQEKDGAPWRNVETTDPYSVDRNREIALRFKPVTAKRFRLNIQLQKYYSGGILKWNLN